MKTAYGQHLLVPIQGEGGGCVAGKASTTPELYEQNELIVESSHHYHDPKEVGEKMEEKEPWV